ncbi:hypothetical protein GCM10010446_31580 [Streptomyces enissocaesilis]|uniref:Flavin reductase like domain-containing protein n=1 Tax=Streptomyces enissocaesilis TaxID=332589 RepID=A0ABN3X964_9ACTN
MGGCPAAGSAGNALTASRSPTRPAGPPAGYGRLVKLDTFIDLLNYPMYVVTAAAAGERSGCLVGFASQCSIHPPRFMVRLSTAHHTCRVARRASHLGVHLLRREDRALAELFGGETGDRVDTFERVAWQSQDGGTPVLTDACAWFVGRVLDLFAGGGTTWVSCWHRWPSPHARPAAPSCSASPTSPTCRRATPPDPKRGAARPRRVGTEDGAHRVRAYSDLRRGDPGRSG